MNDGLNAEPTLFESLDSALKCFKLRDIVRCRLMAYDSAEDNILCNFDGKEDELIRDL